MKAARENLKEAVLWEPAEDTKVHCRLCNWLCTIADGESGRCVVRKNIDGILCSLNYHKVCSANPDPIEDESSDRESGGEK